MPGFDAILFDFDGVLIDSEPVHCACWAEAIAPLGVTLEWDWYRDHCIGIDDRAMLRMMAGRSDPPCDWQAMWDRYPLKKQLFQARMQAAPPFPDALGGMLDRLRPQYKLAVVTSSGRAEVEPLLAAGGLDRYFDTLVCARDTERHKPAPDPYLLAASRLGARLPLVVEDSLAGIAAGQAAGFEVLAVTHPTEVPELLARRLSAALPAR
jgi:beta-phosphoglucomutase